MLPGPLADWIYTTWENPAPPNIEIQRLSPISKAPAIPSGSASTKTYICVPIEEVRDLQGLAKRYPFLRSEIEDVIRDNRNPIWPTPTSVFIADVQQKGMPRMVFVAMDGPLNCGSAGCSLSAYMNLGQGFRNVLSALADISPTYISTDQVSLLTSGSGGLGEWRFKNNEFHPVPGKPRLSQKLPPCGGDATSATTGAYSPVTSTARSPAQTSTSETTQVATETKVDPAAVELSYWESIRNSTNPEDFNAYLAKYPNGHFADLARLRVQQLSRPATYTLSDEAAAAAERARNTRVFEVRDSSKTSGRLTIAPGSLTFEPKKTKEGKSITIQCSEIKYIEQGQSTVRQPHVNLFLNGQEKPVVFYTSSGGSGIVGVFVQGLPTKPVVDITAKVMSAITEACKLH